MKKVDSNTRSVRRSAILGLAFSLAATSAGGFGMTEGQGAWHEKITREALQATMQTKTLDSFAGKSGTLGAVGAPDVNGALNEAQHCDNGDFFNTPGYPQSAATAQQKLVACRKLIFDHLEEAVADLAPLVTANGKVVSSQYPSRISCTYVGGVSGRAKCNALEALGRAMHAAQDFYSHSNWVDQKGSGDASVENPAGLGMTGAAPFLASPTAPFPAALISGCFDKKSVASESSGCNYADGKKRVKHAVLNKDQPEKPRAAIGDNWDRARSAAAEETRVKWAYFEKRVSEVYPGRRGAVMICALKTDSAGVCDD